MLKKVNTLQKEKFASPPFIYITKTNPAIKKILILKKYYLSRNRKSGVPLVH